MKHGKILAAALAVAAPAMLLFCGCGKESAAGPGKSKKPPLVAVQPAAKGPIAQELQVVGDVAATNTVTIQATVEGPIAYCPWREGDRIDEAGRKLIGIDRPLYRQETVAGQAALAVAEAKLADLKAGARPEEVAQARETVTQLEECSVFARNDLERVQKLAESGSVPGEEVGKARVSSVKCQTELVSAKERLAMLQAGPTETQIAIQEALVQEAAAKLAVANAKLAECTIPAPFAGTVTKVHVRPGDLATVRTPLLEMMETSSLVVRFAVPESQAWLIKQGADVSIRFDAYPGRQFAGRVVRTYPELDDSSRTRTVEASLVEAIDLLPGMFARTAVTIRRVEDACIVSDKAILSMPNGDAVVFIADGGRAVLRKVELGIEDGSKVQVLGGVQHGENVIIAGNETLKNGMEIRVKGGKAGPAAQREGI
ncbi:MAG: efflux RND transporter periplasmic adaptor subunit [Planctomycetes bacterium]|nr:efflux RND transporter periplasmic adaptor subunit [Planctomycetota bacterium]